MIILCLTKSTLNYATAYRKDIYFVVLFLESFCSEVCKNRVGVLLVWSWVSLWVWTHGPVKGCTIIFAAFYGHWTENFFIHQNITKYHLKADPARLTSVGASAQAPGVARIKAFEEWRSFPWRTHTISKARVRALASTLSYVYVSSDWSLRLQFYSHICSAQASSASLTGTNVGPTFSLLCNFE